MSDTGSPEPLVYKAFFGDTFTYVTTSCVGSFKKGFIFSTDPISDESTKSLGNQTQVCQKLLSDWSKYINVLHMIGHVQSQMNERLRRDV